MDPISAAAADLDDPAHQHAIRRLLDEYARDPMGNGRALPPDVLERLVPGLRAFPNARVFLAFDGAAPVGLAICFVGFSTFNGRPLVNVHDLAVSPARRRRGVGRALLDAVEACARELGCCRLTLEVRVDNAPARALYRRFGFGDVAFGDADQEPVIFQHKPLG